jgi:hypothetical protein
MSETGSGSPERPFEMGDEIIARRQEIARVILLVFLAAAALNFFTGILASLIWEKYKLEWWVWGLPLLTLVICGFFALWSYSGQISKRVHFEILFPFRCQSEMATAKGNYYKPLQEVEQRVREFFAKRTAETAAVAKDWQELIEKNQRTIVMDKSPQLLAFLIDLAEFFVIDTLAHFGDDSLTPGARYTRLGWVRPNYDSVVLRQDNELAVLRNNLLFRHLPDLVPQGLRFLKGFSFNRKPMLDQKKKEAGYFEFVSQYGSVRFTISPFPIMMPDDSRDKQLIARYCKLFQEDIIAIKIPFMMAVDFRGLRPLRKRFSEKFAPWIEDLVEAIQHKIDWQHCAKHDLERMVVDLLGREV